MNELITKSLELGDVHLLFGFPKQLMSKFEGKVVEWISDYVRRYNQPPTIERLCKEFDTFVPRTTPDPLGDIYEIQLVKKRNHYTREYMTQIQDELKKGVDPLPFIQELYRTVNAGGSDITKYSTFDRSVYHRKPTSYPYGIDILDRYTGGASPGDLIYLIGRLGTGKTTFALYMLGKWLMADKRILMVSNENRADDVIAKIDSYIGGFNPIKKRTMEWSEDDLNRISTVSFIASRMKGDVYIPNRPVQDVKEVQGLIMAHQPDIVIVDGIYLMNGAGGDSHWEKITSISRNLKQLAEGEGVPIVGIHQANRNAVGKKIEVEHIAYADALAQDADLLLAINPEDDGSIFVESIKNRWGKSQWGFLLKFYFDTMTAKVLDAKTSAMSEEES